MQFSKFHGLGNDYIIINEFNKEVIPETKKAITVKELCERRFSIGADGVLFVCPPTNSAAEVRMRIFNADGSEAEMCGNGIRCFTKYVYEQGIVNRSSFRVETLAGIKIPVLSIENEKIVSVRVDMGEPKLLRHEIPMKGPNTRVINEPLKVNGVTFNITCVSMGNPHCIIFKAEGLKNLDITVGKRIEYHEVFPQKINVEFVKVISPKEIEMRVWERGVGETLACGTGACAVTVASVLNQKTNRAITVHLLGGNLDILWDESTNHVFMTGIAEHVYDGEINKSHLLI